MNKSDDTLDLAELQLLEKIGKDPLGQVYKAKDVKTGAILLTKRLNYEQDGNEKINASIDNFIHTNKVISNLCCPSIIKFIGFSPLDHKNEPNPVIITEFLENIPLSDLINSNNEDCLKSKWDDTQKLITLYGVAAVLSFLHSIGLIHSDLKPSNILLDKNYEPRLSDIGISKIKNQEYNKDSIIYVAPEIIKSDYTSYTKEGDVYAYSIIAYQILSNKKTFDEDNDQEMIHKMQNGARPKFNFPISDTYVELIQKCWSKEPLNRPNFDEIAQELRTNHHFITKSIDKKKYQSYINKMDEILSNSLYNYGKMHYNGDLLPKDKEKAAFYFKKAADLGHVNSMIAYSIILHNGDGVPNDPVEKGSPEAMYFYSVRLSIGDGIERDVETSAFYLKKAADQGLLEAIMEYLKKMNNGIGVEHNDEEYLHYLKLAADRGNASAMTDYALNLFQDKKHDKEAERYLRMAADAGDPTAMYTLAFLLEGGELIPKNDQLSVEYYKKASEKGHPDAIYRLASIYFIGKMVKADLKESARLFKISADKGNSKAMMIYAMLTASGNGIPMNKKEAFKYFKLCADKGEPDAMFHYATMCKEDEQNFSEYVRYLKMAAEGGNTEAMSQYAGLLATGHGVTMDLQKSLHYFKLLADRGDPLSMYNYALGIKGKSNKEYAYYLKMAADKNHYNAIYTYAIALINGDGVPVNMEEAAHYLKISIDIGNKSAISSYASLLRQGKGVQLDKKEAARLYKIAADENDADSMFNYAVMLRNGEGIAKNSKEAILYFQKAIKKGHSKSMYAYSEMLERGEGVDVNIKEAEKYRKMAEKNECNMILYLKGLELIEESHNIDAGFAMMKQAADDGCIDAMRMYATYLSTGHKCLKMNKKESSRYYKMAADLGDTISMLKYATMVDSGEGGKLDRKESAKYFKMAADNGDVSAMYQYSKKVHTADGVKKDIKEQFKYLKMDADRGNLEAMFSFAVMLENGLEIKMNKKEAAHYYKMSANKGLVPAISKYAEMALAGDGIQKNKEEAIRYFKMAAEKGDKSALQILSQLT